MHGYFLFLLLLPSYLSKIYKISNPMTKSKVRASSDNYLIDFTLNGLTSTSRASRTSAHGRPLSSSLYRSVLETCCHSSRWTKRSRSLTREEWWPQSNMWNKAEKSLCIIQEMGGSVTDRPRLRSRRLRRLPHGDRGKRISRKRRGLSGDR